MENMNEKKNDDVLEEDVVSSFDDRGEEIEMTPAKKDVKVNTKYVIIIVAVGLLIALGYHYRGVFIAATVDGSPISRLSVIHELEKTTGKQALTSLVTQKVIAAEVKKKGVVVGDEEVDAEIKRISDIVTAQGGQIETVLAAQGMTLLDFRQRALMQLQVEKLLGDKIVVTDADVEAYIKENDLAIPKDQMDKARGELKEQMRRNKVGQEGQTLVDSLIADAKITYFGAYIQY